MQLKLTPLARYLGIACGSLMELVRLDLSYPSQNLHLLQGRIDFWLDGPGISPVQRVEMYTLAFELIARQLTQYDDFLLVGRLLTTEPGPPAYTPMDAFLLMVHYYSKMVAEGIPR